jgi:hypothetical protein
LKPENAVLRGVVGTLVAKCCGSMAAGYPDRPRPGDGWFWPILLGWIFLVSVLAFAGLLSVGEIADLTGQHAVPPKVEVSPPSP